MKEELIRELATLWGVLGCLRFGQLLDDLLAIYKRETNRDPFYATDAEFLDFMRRRNLMEFPHEIPE